MKRHWLWSRVTAKDLAIGSTVGLLIAALVTSLRMGTLSVTASQPLSVPEIAANVSAPVEPLTESSTATEVIGLMLNSHLKWHSLNLEGTTLVEDVGVLPRSTWSQLQVEQFGKARFEVGPDATSSTFVWVSDGNTIWTEDRLKDTYTERAMPADLRSLEAFHPPFAPANGQPYVIPHPLDALIPSSFAGFVFPQSLAQSILNHGILDVIGKDVVAGRDAVVALWQIEDRAGITAKKHKYWIDTMTGVILKREVYGTADGDLTRWTEQTTVTQLTYDQVIPQAAFTFTPAPGAQRVSPAPPRP